jgi:2-polyprenyl-3-methyl-5-hydroxy-6-metoxy-1,4-benzoquinol methylase
MEKTKSGWDKTVYLKEQELDDYAWHRGFFMIDFVRRDLWVQNFTELRNRDISLFTIGDVKGKSVLDIGCGQGMYMLTFLKLGASRVAGIDILEKDVKISNDVIRKNGFNPEAQVADCTQLPYPKNSFDIVFSGDVFEHITYEQKDKCVREIYRVLKPGAIVTIKTPNLKYQKLTNFFRRLKAIARLKNPFKIHIAHTRNNPDNEHIGLTTHKEMRELFLKNTFHEPVNTYVPLERKGFPKSLARLFCKSHYQNEVLVITSRKPIFLGLYDPA